MVVAVVKVVGRRRWLRRCVHRVPTLARRGATIVRFVPPPHTTARLRASFAGSHVFVLLGAGIHYLTVYRIMS